MALLADFNIRGHKASIHTSLPPVGVEYTFLFLIHFFDISVLYLGVLN